MSKCSRQLLKFQFDEISKQIEILRLFNKSKWEFWLESFAYFYVW